ncbi:hypothetical protein TRVA0_033S00166 [Trichomonascus vanleenenianus]|uniref:cleavage polyadenylation factor subunit FIP1 n=1 Tax=Trichomonascus vanleenenianus TaxID=2268995 RepID=UPI003ECA1E7B
MNSDDEDDYLYGGRAEEPEAKRQKTHELTKEQQPVEPTKEPMEVEDEEEESESDSDVEFVINTGQKVAAPSSSVGQYSQKEEAKEAPAAAQPATGATKTQLAAAATTTSAEKPAPLDINAVAEHNGVPLTQVVLENLEEKPWRKPGADVTDYFNYGFDEFTWTAYCSKQDNLREDFAPQKVMSQMMGMPMDMPMFPPPGMGFNAPNGMPNGMAQMMMGMMNMPQGQQGSPPPPPPPPPPPTQNAPPPPEKERDLRERMRERDRGDRDHDRSDRSDRSDRHRRHHDRDDRQDRRERAPRRR